MVPKNFLVILLAFCTSMLLGSGVSIVFSVAGFKSCAQVFCLTIKDFVLLYRTIFFTFGVMLTVCAIFGLLAMIWENPKMLAMYAKLLIFIIVSIFLIFWLGVWSRGTMQLHKNLVRSFEAHDTSNCRLRTAIDHLQMKFKCCGVEGPDDWSYLRHPSLFNENKTDVLPLSCCSTDSLNIKSFNIECSTPYPSGCFGPLHQYIWRIFSIITVMGLVIALKTTAAVICTFKLISILEQPQRTTFSEANLPLSPVVTPIQIMYQPNDYPTKTAPSSTVV